MREIFLTDIICEVLGPRFGLNEQLKNKPLNEYITGVLSPKKINKDHDEEIYNTYDDEFLKPTSADDVTDIDMKTSSSLSSVLDPTKNPSAMGISFYSKSINSEPIFDICITWARYSKKNNFWERTPRYSVFKFDGNYTIFFDKHGNQSIKKTEETEISIHISVDKSSKDNHHDVTVYLINEIQVELNSKPSSEHHIFQPQIRIIAVKPNTEIITKIINSKSDDDKELEMQYRDREILAKGHMTSAIWPEVDPEINQKFDLDFPNCKHKPGLFWTDGELLNNDEKIKFAQHYDVRTEFVPMYSVPTSKFVWNGKNQPILNAETLAEKYDKKSLKDALLPFDTEYNVWIEKLKHEPMQNEQIKSKIIDRIEFVHKRIKDGINFLIDNEYARLAFCFANKSMSIQYNWSHNKLDKQFEYRPFQLAFILMTIESTLNPKSEHRKICDLLWVTTGGGKTEAYLALVAMVASYRRLKSINRIINNSDAGTSVLSRYTLKLLTIQQFRRTLSLFTSMEYLRVYNLDQKCMIGWRPKQCDLSKNFLWGTTQFSTGLWVGENLTPNKLVGSTFKPEAINILKEPNIRSKTGSPAQILNCPACNSILSISKKTQLTGSHTIHFVISTRMKNIVDYDFNDFTIEDVKIIKTEITKHEKENYYTISLTTSSDSNIIQSNFTTLWSFILDKLKNNAISVKLSCAHPTNPGYFFRKYVTTIGTSKEYDFEVYCPNPKCLLRKSWVSGNPLSKIDHRSPDITLDEEEVYGIECPINNHFSEIIKPFQRESSVIADRIPIPCFTVDEQIYANLPTMIVSTIDKIAQISSKPQISGIFGNVDSYHCMKGYYRKPPIGKIPLPEGRTKNNFVILKSELDTIDLIIQDELHLVDGPLGSMTGIYESAIDYLSTHKGKIPKYIASTATIKRASEHIKSLYSRDSVIFPPPGLSICDRFFITEFELHPLDDKIPGRLYVGIMAPGRGSLTPNVRIWSRMLQTAYENQDHKNIDLYWTLVGYFSAMRDLAGVNSLCQQDIPERLQTIYDESRTLDPKNTYELSSNINSTDLPHILNMLNMPKTHNAIASDILLATSMFGTGIDISRLSAMIVNGQPKTSSSYIQATGRVGRLAGAIVIVSYRSRPRDLTHYEFFIRYHRHLHKFVEPPTVFPFAKMVRNRTLGPVIVGILRNMRTNKILAPNESANTIEQKEQEIESISEMFANRAMQQPMYRTINRDEILDNIKSLIQRWGHYAQKHKNLCYTSRDDVFVVLGNSKQSSKKLAVYDNAPMSLRDVESETRFESM